MFLVLDSVYDVAAIVPAGAVEPGRESDDVVVADGHAAIGAFDSN
jgi:hypothetical protein